MSSIVEQSIISLYLDPEVRTIFKGHLEPWMFKSDWAIKVAKCLNSNTFDGRFPDLQELIVELHSNYGATATECETVAGVMYDYKAPANRDRVIAYLESWIRDAYLADGVETIASGNDKDYRQRGLDAIKQGINFQVGVDTFTDYTAPEAVEKAELEDLPHDGKIIKSSFGVINDSLSYKGYKYGDLTMVAAESGCHAADEGILMYDGSVKMSQDVQVGDQLMGPDSQPRTVLSLVRGQDQMYRVTTTKGDSFIVNQHHRLWVKETTRQSSKWTPVTDVTPKDITIKEFLSRPLFVQKNKIKLLKAPVDYKQAQARQINKDVLHHGIASIELLGLGDYYGWRLDKDHLYLDDDFIVHHNCGKSTFLLTEAAEFIRSGHTVAHFVLGDMSEFDLFLKYLANFTDTDIEEILQSGWRSWYTDDIKALMQRLRVKALDPDTYDVYQIIAKAEQLRRKFPFDALIVDYDGNIKDTSDGGSYVEGGVVYANLKGYARGRCAAFIASQTKIQYWGEELILKNYANDSSKKQHHLDLMVGLGANKECRSVGTLNLAKVRRGITDRRTRVEFMNGRGLIREIRQDRYEALIQRHKLKGSSISYNMQDLINQTIVSEPGSAPSA